MDYIMTEHSKLRINQRGFVLSDIDLLHKYGDYRFQGTGGKIIYFSKSISKMAKLFSRDQLKKIEKN